MLIDTSVWIEYFKGTKLGLKLKDKIESGQLLFINPLTIAELTQWSEKNSLDTKKILEFVYANCKVLNLSNDILEFAGKNYNTLRQIKTKIGLIDVIIYVSAIINNLVLLTKDYDFNGLTGVELLI